MRFESWGMFAVHATATVTLAYTAQRLSFQGNSAYIVPVLLACAEAGLLSIHTGQLLGEQDYNSDEYRLIRRVNEIVEEQSEGE